MTQKRNEFSATTEQRKCRACDTPLSFLVLDLGRVPIANELIPISEPNPQQELHPLQLYLCEECHLLQLGATLDPERLFRKNPYESGYSSTWKAHIKSFVEQMFSEFHWTRESLVVEVGSNDGSLLSVLAQYPSQRLGVEPRSQNQSRTDSDDSTPIERDFFSNTLAGKILEARGPASWIIANNVLAHVPNINDFVEGLATLLAPRGILTLEIPHLLALIDTQAFDTIYHEHVFYFSLHSLTKLLARHGLAPFRVEELSTHGGSLRVFVTQSENTNQFPGAETVSHFQQREKDRGIASKSLYQSFPLLFERHCQKIMEFVLQAKREGKRMAAYGAPAKAAMLLHNCGITPDTLPYTVDKNPLKLGHKIPGSQVPIYPTDQLEKDKPDYVFVFPWNLEAELSEQLSSVSQWGGKLVFPSPNLHVT